MVWAILLICLLFNNVSVGNEISADDFRRLEKGEARLFYGMITGDPSQVAQAIEERASIQAPIDPFIGEKVMLLGKAFVDFPVCPPLHMALLYGKKSTLNVAAMLLRMNLDANKYSLPPSSLNFTHRGYPPALLYALGYGQKPTNAHAAMVQRLYRTFPTKFNISVLEEWRNRTASAPLVHQMIYLQNFDGLYVTVTELNRDMFEIDPVGNISALHIAAWFGDVSSVVFLLHNRADPFQRTSRGHLPIHFAIFRQHQNIFAILFAHVMERATSQKAKRSQWDKLLTLQDKYDRDMLDMVLQPPRFFDAISFIANLSEKLEFPLINERTPENIQKQLTFEFILNKLDMIEDSHESNVDSNICPPMGIDRHTPKQLSKNRFLRDYYCLQRPVLISKGVADGLGIWAYLQSSGESSLLDGDVFFDRYGHLQFVSWEEDSDVRTGALREFASSLRYLFPQADSANNESGSCQEVDSEEESATCGSSSLSSQQNSIMVGGQVIVTAPVYHSSQLSSDVYRLSLFQSICRSGFYDPVSRGRDLQLETLLGLNAFNLTFLPPSQIHHSTAGRNSNAGGGEHDSQSWSAVLLAGENVTWYLWSPGIDTALQRSQIFTNQTVDKVLKLLRSRCLVHEAIQRVGEVLFIPDGYHAIAVADDHKGAIILSQPVCKWINTESRLQRLGYVVYGEEVDDYRGFGRHRFHHYPADAMPKKLYKSSSKVPVFE